METCARSDIYFPNSKLINNFKLKRREKKWKVTDMEEEKKEKQNEPNRNEMKVNGKCSAMAWIKYNGCSTITKICTERYAQRIVAPTNYYRSMRMKQQKSFAQQFEEEEARKGDMRQSKFSNWKQPSPDCVLALQFLSDRSLSAPLFQNHSYEKFKHK